MVKRGNTRLATKTDLVEGLQGLNSKIDGLRTELKGDIGGLRTELKGDIDGLRKELKGDIRRVALALDDTNGRVRAIQDGLDKQFAAQNSRLTGILEPFAARMETIWREAAVYPRMLDEQGATLLGHETRITALEARRTP